MEEYLIPILEQGGPIGALVVAFTLVLGFLMRQKGWLFSDTGKVVSNTALAEIRSHVGDIDKRLGVVEHDIEQLPTRAELHELQISYVRLSERLAAMDHTVTATNRAVARIEDFMIEVSKGGR